MYTQKKRVHLFWYQDVFFVVSRCPKSPFWYRDLFFGIAILHSVFQHLDCPHPGINLCVLFWSSTSCKVEVNEDLDAEKNIKKSRYLKKDISIPTKRVTHKKMPLFFFSGNNLCIILWWTCWFWSNFIQVCS